MIKILALFLQNDLDNYNEKMGEMVGGVIFVLLIIMLIGWMISKYKKSA